MSRQFNQRNHWLNMLRIFQTSNTPGGNDAMETTETWLEVDNCISRSRGQKTLTDSRLQFQYIEKSDRQLNLFANFLQTWRFKEYKKWWTKYDVTYSTLSKKQLNIFLLQQINWMWQSSDLTFKYDLSPWIFHLIWL